MSTQPSPFEFRPIGMVETPFEERDEPPRQGSTERADGSTVLAEGYAPGVDGVEPGDELNVVWVAHRADRDRLEAHDRGVFTTRSPARPNPICVTPCTVRAISDDRRRIDVVGVDMLDGSPVLDLKAPIR